MDTTTPIVQPTAKTNHHWKWKFYLVIIIILLGLGAYGYYQIQILSRQLAEAQMSVAKAQKFDALQTAVQTELNRCKNFIAQPAGNFKAFEYCIKFIQWAAPLQTP